MSAASDHLETALLAAVLKNTSYSSPATTYLALFTSDPTDADTGTEVSGGGYARQALSFTGTGDSVTTSAAVAFTASGAAFGTITHIGIYDAVSGGNLLLHGALIASRTIADGATLTFAAGDITVGIA